jgi:hypothetical protein
MYQLPPELFFAAPDFSVQFKGSSVKLGIYTEKNLP